MLSKLLHPTICMSILAAMSGCGSEQLPGEPVVGNVSVDGNPIVDGRIWFLPTSRENESRIASAAIVEGAYEIDSGLGPVPGRHVVRIEAYDRSKEQQEVFDEDTGETVTKNVEMVEQLLPAQFNRSTQLDAEIKSGENKLDFNLATSPK